MSTELQVPLATVCRLTGAPRSSVYAGRQNEKGQTPERRGPKTEMSDEDLTEHIRVVIRSSPFAGEGHRKVTARLRREHGIRVGRKRVLRLMRAAGLLAPQRVTGRRAPRPHDGTIIPARPDTLWGTDATMGYTQQDGWCWVFCCVDHATVEAWATVAERGDRFAALEPIQEAVRDRWGELGPDLARGLSLRHDWAPQYTSGYFRGALRWLGITDSPAFVGEPPCNGMAEWFIRVLKEQCLWARAYETIDDLRKAVREFVERFNTQWLIGRHGHLTPREAYARSAKGQAA